MKLFILIIVLIIGTILSTSYLHVQGEALAQRTNGIKAVHDCVHEYLPDFSAYYRLYNVLLFVFVSPLIVFFGNYSVLSFILAFLWVFVPVTIFRCMTISASIPTRTTNDVQHDFGSWVKRHLFGGHDDKLPSGHLCLAFTLILTMLQFKIIKNVKLWLGLLGAYGLFSTMTRQHYTNDILVAFIVVPVFFDWTNCRSLSKDLLWGGCRL